MGGFNLTNYFDNKSMKFENSGFSSFGKRTQEKLSENIHNSLYEL